MDDAAIVAMMIERHVLALSGVSVEMTASPAERPMLVGGLSAGGNRIRHAEPAWMVL